MANEYYTVEDYHGSPFGPGEPIPSPEGTPLHEALAIFRDCKNAISRDRFLELGGRPEDLDELLGLGQVVPLK